METKTDALTVDRVKEETSPGLCRCCLEAGLYNVYNSLTSTGDGMETYAEMLFMTFTLDVMNSEIKEEDNYICNDCINRLKNAFTFKTQIEEVQKELMQRSIYEKVIIAGEGKVKDESDSDWNVEYLEEEFKDVLSETKGKKHKKRGRCKYVSKDVGRENGVGDKLYERSLLKQICRDKLQCLICMEHFQNVHVLTQHLNVHYPNYICDTCGKAFASKRRIMAHSRVHEKCDYTCEECKLTFDTKCKWQNHTAKHKRTMRYCCTQCPERFKDFFQREKHLVAQHGKLKNAYQCRRCDSTFGTAGHLSAHTRRVHLQERNKICSVCSMSFFSSIELSHHEISHTGKRTHICPVCHKGYPRSKTLKEHMKIHTNEKRFFCSICKRSFTQKCTLKGHMRTHGKSNGTPCVIEESKKIGPSGEVLIYMNVKEEVP